MRIRDQWISLGLLATQHPLQIDSKQHFHFLDIFLSLFLTFTFFGLVFASSQLNTPCKLQIDTKQHFHFLWIFLSLFVTFTSQQQHPLQINSSNFFFPILLSMNLTQHLCDFHFIWISPSIFLTFLATQHPLQIDFTILSSHFHFLLSSLSLIATFTFYGSFSVSLQLSLSLDQSQPPCNSMSFANLFYTQLSLFNKQLLLFTFSEQVLAT